MDVSNCPECKKALRAALLKGADISKIKMVDGHLPGCPTQKKGDTDAVRRPEAAAPPLHDPQAYPWAESNYRIAPPQRQQSAPPALNPTQGWPAGGGLPGGDPTPHVAPGGHDWGTGSPGDRRSEAAGNSDRRHKPRRRSAVPNNSYAQAEAENAARYAQLGQQGQGEQPQYAPANYVRMPSSRGEKRDQRKGVWFIWLVLGTAFAGVFFPPLALVGVGMIAMLFLRR